MFVKILILLSRQENPDQQIELQKEAEKCPKKQ